MGALDGIKVLDLTRLAPGMYCTMLLADFGASVLRIEETGTATGHRAGQGQSTAAASSSATLVPEKHGFVPRYSPFNALSRNKKSIALNLKAEGALGIFYELAKRSDVVVEGFRYGVTKRLGIDYDTLKRINPSLICCGLTGYGQDGPYRDLVGHDIDFIAMGGVLSLLAKKGEAPAIPGNIVADSAGGLQAAFGILSAIIARQRTGKGQFVDASLHDSVLSLLAHTLSWSYATGQSSVGQGEHSMTGFYPFYDTYKTSEGKFISIGCLEPWLYENLCRTLGREDLIPCRLAEDEQTRGKVRNAFQQIFRTKTRDEWFDILSKHDIAVGKVLGFDELADDPQIKARQTIVELDHLGKKVKQVGISVKLSDTPGQIVSLTPQPGQHTEEVMLELGYDRTQIMRFEEAGTIQQWKR